MTKCFSCHHKILHILQSSLYFTGFQKSSRNKNYIDCDDWRELYIAARTSINYYLWLRCRSCYYWNDLLILLTLQKCTSILQWSFLKFELTENRLVASAQTRQVNLYLLRQQKPLYILFGEGEKCTETVIVWLSVRNEPANMSRNVVKKTNWWIPIGQISVDIWMSIWFDLLFLLFL